MAPSTGALLPLANMVDLPKDRGRPRDVEESPNKPHMGMWVTMTPLFL
jgi:hypothetical protein